MHVRIGTGRAPVLLFVMAALLAAVSAAPAAAQTTTPFVPLQAPYLDVTPGVGFGGTSGQRTIQLETDGVPGLTGSDVTYALPAVVEQSLASFPPNARLSPSRRWLVMWGTRAGGTPGVKLFVYRVPGTFFSTLEPLVVGRDMAGEDQIGFYDDPSPAGRHVFCFVESEVNFEQRLHWVDLDSGVSAWSQGIGTGVGWPIVTSPGGEAAFVRTDGALFGTADYHLVELCPDDLGTLIGVGGWQDIAGPVSCALLDDGTGIFAQVTHDGVTDPAIPLDDCTAAPPVTGACCVDFSCVDGVTQSVCETELGGTWQGAGSDCGTAGCPTPPTPILSLTQTGPTDVEAAAPATYSLHYDNTGTGPAADARITTTVAGNVTFMSATGGGVFDPATRRVTWTLGTLDGGVAGTVSFSLKTDCQTTSYAVSQAQLTSSNAFGVNAVGMLVQVHPASTAPVDVALAKTLPQGEPLNDNDTVIYDIAMTNPEPQERLLNLYFRLGSPLMVDAVLDSAGGTVTASLWDLTWQGVIPAQQTRTLSVRGVVPACRTGFLSETRLNEGNVFSVRNACFVPVADIMPDTTALAPSALTSRLVVTAQGATRILGGGQGWVSGKLARPGATVGVRWVIRNTRTTDVDVGAGGTVCSLGDLVPSGNSPFVAPTPPGLTWDAALNRAAWSGVIAGGDSVVVLLEAEYPASGVCNTSIFAQASIAGCTQVMTSIAARINGLDEAWTDPHLVTLTSWGELERLRPGVDVQSDPWFCTNVEIFHSLSRVNDDVYWLVGLPTLRVDAANLDVAELPGNLPGLDMDNITCAVEDTAAGVVYLGGHEFIGGQPHLRLRRVDLTTLQVDDVLNDTRPVRTWINPQRLILDRQGRLVMTTQGSGLTRLDPGDSTTVETIAEPDSIAFAQDVSLMHDGRYLVPEFQWGGFGLPRRVAAVDPATLSYEILADQDAGPWGSTQPAVAAAEGDSGQIYLAYLQFRVGVVDLTADPPTLTGVAGYLTGSYIGLAYAGGGISTAVSEGPDAPPSLRTIFAGAAPNPFNPRTELRFELAAGGPVLLELFDVQGRRVRTLVSGRLAAGEHRVLWQGRDDGGRDLPSGLYLARFRADGVQRTAKLMLAR